MSLTYSLTIAVGTTVKDAINNEATNQILVLTTGNVITYNISSGSTVSTSQSLLSTPVSLCLLNSASALVVSSAVSTADVVELSSGFRQNYSGGGTGKDKVQTVACITASSIAYGFHNTDGSLVKFNASTFTLSTVANNRFLSEDRAFTIISIPGDRLLIGTEDGVIHEVDANLTCYGSMSIPVLPSLRTGERGGNAQTYTSQAVMSMTYFEGIILCSTVPGLLHKIHWPTKTILEQYLISASAGTLNPITLGENASGIVGIADGPGNTSASKQSLAELDFMESPINYRDFLYTTSGASFLKSGVKDSKLWGLHNAASNVFVASVVPRTTTTVVTTATGVGESGRILRIIDQGSSSYVEYDSALSDDPETLLVSSGKNIIEVVLYGEGVDEQASLSEYST